MSDIPPPPPEEPTPADSHQRVLKDISVNGSSVKNHLNHVRAPSDGVHPSIPTISAIAHKNVPSLKSVDKPVTGLSETMKNVYLKDTGTEARTMRRNSKLMDEMHSSLPPPPFPDDDVPPPPPSSEAESKRPAFLNQINPKNKVHLSPVVGPHDGLNPNLATLEAIKNRRPSLNSVPPPPPTELHPDVADSWLQEEQMEIETLRRNTVVMEAVLKAKEDKPWDLPGRDRKATVSRLKALANDD